jgi:hypothetical protein
MVAIGYLPGGGGGGVESVNGDTGPDVVLDAGDVGADVVGAAANALDDATDYTDTEIAGLTPGDVGADPAGTAATAAAAAIVTANAYTDQEVTDGVNAALTYTDQEIADAVATITAVLTAYMKLPASDAEVVATWTAVDQWLRVNTPFSAGDANPDFLRLFNGANQTMRLNGNVEARFLPSTDGRNGCRIYEFENGSTDAFGSFSTNPTNPALREDLFFARGTLAATRGGWMVASRGIEVPEIRQNNLSMLPTAFTVPVYNSTFAAATAVSNGSGSSNVSVFGSQLVPFMARVFLRGSIVNSGGVSIPANTTVCTITAGHRPPERVQWAGRTSTNLAVRVTVDNTGIMTLDQAMAAAATLSLDGGNWGV